MNSGERQYAAEDAEGRSSAPCPRDTRSANTGSVVVFVTMPSGKRYAFIGDLTWQLDGIRRRVERPLLLRKLADSDPEQVRPGLLRVIALADLMQIVPAHDRNAYDGSHRLPA